MQFRNVVNGDFSSFRLLAIGTFIIAVAFVAFGQHQGHEMKPKPTPTPQNTPTPQRNDKLQASPSPSPAPSIKQMEMGVPGRQTPIASPSPTDSSHEKSMPMSQSSPSSGAMSD